MATNCTKCNTKKCRNTQACGIELFNNKQIINAYQNPVNQKIIRSASSLVDDGRAGTLSRVQELIEFSKDMGFKKLGLAYCWGMEAKAAQLSQLLIKEGFELVAASCTIGGIAQDEINIKSPYHSVGCNPIAQAEQLNAQKVDLAITFGLCLGHDILFNRTINTYVSTLVVKDRVHEHNPLKEFE